MHLEELRRLRRLRAAEHAEFQKLALRQSQELERVTEKVCGCVGEWGRELFDYCGDVQRAAVVTCQLLIMGGLLIVI